MTVLEYLEHEPHPDWDPMLRMRHDMNRMSYYRVCPRCGANLDPGEICDCTGMSDHEPIRTEGKGYIDYVALGEYAKAYPDKLAKLFSDRCADDDMRGFSADFYKVACDPDWDGPDFEKWRVS